MATILHKNPGKWTNRVLIGTPMTGLVRSEWMTARYGQTIPTNWSHIEVMNWMSAYIPLGYQVADAENIIAKQVVEHNFEWLLFIEHDNVLPPNTFVRLNQYMISGKVPIVGALYFTKSDPPEPMVYRDFGKGYYADWKLGQKVWVRGLPFGCTLIHGSIIRALWEEAEPVTINGTETRRIFRYPEDRFTDPETVNPLDYLMTSGTSDLQFCKEVVEKRIFEKAGWPEYQKKKYPFLVDTSIFVKHIDMNGTQWPTALPRKFAQGKATLRSCLI